MVKMFTANAVERIGAETEFRIAAFSGAVFSSRKNSPIKIAGYIHCPA